MKKMLPYASVAIDSQVVLRVPGDFGAIANALVPFPWRGGSLETSYGSGL